MLNDFVIQRKVLIVNDAVSSENQVLQSAIERLRQALADRYIGADSAASYGEARMLVDNNMNIDCFLLSSGTGDAAQETAFLAHLKERQRAVPVFLLADRARTIDAISAELMKMATEFVWIMEDSPEFIAGRIAAAITRFRKHLMPPLMAADLSRGIAFWVVVAAQYSRLLLWVC